MTQLIAITGVRIAVSFRPAQRTVPIEDFLSRDAADRCRDLKSCADRRGIGTPEQLDRGNCIRGAGGDGRLKFCGSSNGMTIEFIQNVTDDDAGLVGNRAAGDCKDQYARPIRLIGRGGDRHAADPEIPRQ
jgi:hypothetical protein